MPLYLSRAAQRCKRLAPENGICVVVCGTKNKEEVYELTRSGYHIAIVLDDSFVLDEDSKARLKVFTYVITHYDAMYDKLKDEFDILYIPS